MGTELKKKLDDRLIFADEDNESLIETGNTDKKEPWKVLIVDDEEEVHEITRITLRGYSFESRGLELFSAYSEADVKSILEKEPKIALILLDVVMEKDDSGLLLVEYIRKKLNNSFVRIVLRTGQPGKAPEQEVIKKYDINDYKTKPELTAQKLFTSVTSCLRAYDNLITIERNNKGLEAIIQSSAIVFKNHSFSKFGFSVLKQLLEILYPGSKPDVDSAYFVGMPNSRAAMIAGTGKLSDKAGSLFDESMPETVLDAFNNFALTGGEAFLQDEYIGVFKTKEEFTSILYLQGCKALSTIQKNLVRIYANNIAIGFDNISLSREIINTQKEVILTLGEIVETRSQETAHHVTRVAEICYLLAKKAGIDEKTCELLRLASPMHDVGKIGVPEAVLNKPGKLTDDEFKIIQQHSQTGYEILKKSNRSIMKMAAIVALQHHEKWDGSGYPQGLSGEDIHVFGRIAAIADVFDALTHKRCYKDAWPLDKVVKLFETEAGHHFDAKLVDIFLININEFSEIINRFPE